jgi:hypothetical protein
MADPKWSEEFGVHSGPAVLRGAGRRIAQRKLGSLEALMILDTRGQAGLKDPAHQERAFDRIRRPSGFKHLLNLAYQAGGVRHVGNRRQEKLRGRDAPEAPYARRN